MLQRGPEKVFLLDSVDDYLGPAEKRFFGEGFRRVTYRYGALEVTPVKDARVELESRLDVGYPVDWSAKAKHGDLRPHLSTVDGLIIGVNLSEAALVHTLALSPENRRASRAVQIRIKAGTSPDEDLTALPVRTSVLGGAVAVDAVDETVTRTETLVGGMRVRTEVQHPAGDDRTRTPDTTSSYASPDALLGAADERYYGTGFTSRAQMIRKVAVDAAHGRADAVVDIAQGPGSVLPMEGTEGLYQPFVGLVDAFVTSLQLGQILMYETDGISRGASNTLWMRTTVLTASASPEPIRYESPLRVQLENSSLLERPDGVWRAVDIVGRLAGNSVRCSVAHRLPR
ncbi:AvrD family protein [Streptomyces sp. NPDC096323]|uniref:AvrD family protein n=1 Tax=Streptomyces sp. NPDC096323 TaxID=3155822 RepID=UPI0033206D46